MRFIVIEGLDGAGKSTQINLLQDYLEKENVKYKYLHFPRTESPFYGELVARFLRGEFGDINTVDPYMVALIYGGDRMDAAPTIHSWIDEGYQVIVDRYVDSNIAFQCAKLKDENERKELRNWILQFEFEYNKIPRPDLVVFLDVPFQFTREKLSNNRTGGDREYLNGKQDIHELDLSFQEKVREMYLMESTYKSEFQVVDCGKDTSSILPPQEIFEKILNLIHRKEILKKAKQ